MAGPSVVGRIPRLAWAEEAEAMGIELPLLSDRGNAVAGAYVEVGDLVSAIRGALG